MLVLGIDTTAVAASCAVCEMEADSCKVLMSGTINALTDYASYDGKLVKGLCD